MEINSVYSTLRSTCDKKLSDKQAKILKRMRILKESTMMNQLLSEIVEYNNKNMYMNKKVTSSISA